MTYHQPSPLEPLCLLALILLGASFGSTAAAASVGCGLAPPYAVGSSTPDWMVTADGNRTFHVFLPSGYSDPPSSNPSHIAQHFRSFYAELYTAKPSPHTILDARHTPLPPPASTALSDPILPTHIRLLAGKAKENSAPGPDGLPYALYASSPVLCSLLAKTIAGALLTGDPPTSWLQTYIRPVPKEGKDLTLPSSYRPIALLGADYKLFTGVLTQRPQPHMEGIFPLYQTGFVPIRSTHTAALRY